MSTLDELPQFLNKRQSTTIEIETNKDTTVQKEISSNKKCKINVTTLTETRSSSSFSPTAYLGYQFDNNNNECPKIDIIDINSITSDEFFNLYISKRKPCILNLQSSSSSSSKSNNNINTTIPNQNQNKDDNERLNIVQTTSIEHVIECMLAVETSTTTGCSTNKDDPIIQIEKRPTSNDLFGQNRTPDRQMLLKLSDFVKLMLDMNIPHDKQYDSKNLYYLSTQTQQQQQQSTSASTSASTSPSIVTTNKRQTKNDKNSTTDRKYNNEKDDLEMIYPLPFDTNPCQLLLQENIIPDTFPLSGSLVLDSCNVWMGSIDNSKDNSKDDTDSTINGSNSGLHHDYHDNFYWLLCGQKKFIIYPPSTYNNMYLYGTNPTIQSNGVISYSNNNININNNNNNNNNNNSTIVNNNNNNCSAKVKKYDIASSDDDDDDDDDGNDEESEVLLGKGFDYKSENDSDDVDFDEGKDDFDELCQSDNDNDDGCDESSAHENNDNNNSRRPNNFSRIDMSQLNNSTNNSTIEQEFPQFKNSQQQQCEFTLQRDQCLYLPASWFHCVTSLGSSDTRTNIPVQEIPSTCNSSENNSTTIPTTLHAAINYWYHPPDNLDNSTTCSTDPYTDKVYWQEHRKAVADHIMSTRNRKK